MAPPTEAKIAVLHLFVQPRVLERNAGMECERLDERSVIGAELRSILLVGQVQAADNFTLLL